MKVEVLSLGGSLIIPKATDKVAIKFLKRFKKLITSFRDRKFIIVVGGGSTARKYISALEACGVDKRSRCLMGISITRHHAKFLRHLFGKNAAQQIPTNLQDIKKLLEKNRVIITGALRYEENNTSDGTAAHIANYLKTDFVNITDVKGLYTKDPKKNKDAKLIKEISFTDFNKILSKIQYRPGQHFILDQHAAKLIKRHKIRTMIVGHNLENVKRCLQGRQFTGTTIQG